MEFRSCDSVLEWIEKKVRAKDVIDAHTWVESASYLNILSSEPQEKLFELQQIVAQKKVEFIEKGDSVAMARTKVESSDEYRDLCRQKAKLERITEAIRIAKIQSRLADQNYRNQ